MDGFALTLLGYKIFGYGTGFKSGCGSSESGVNGYSSGLVMISKVQLAAFRLDIFRDYIHLVYLLAFAASCYMIRLYWEARWEAYHGTFRFL